MTGIKQATEPDWAPLERIARVMAVTPDGFADVMGEFMWMYQAGDGSHAYKHRFTRQYAMLTAETPVANGILRVARASGLR